MLFAVKESNINGNARYSVISIKHVKSNCKAWSAEKKGTESNIVNEIFVSSAAVRGKSGKASRIGAASCEPRFSSECGWDWERAAFLSPLECESESSSKKFFVTGALEEEENLKRNKIRKDHKARGGKICSG